ASAAYRGRLRRRRRPGDLRRRRQRHVGRPLRRPRRRRVDGGPGYDRTEDWSIPEQLDNQPAIDVTLDGVANDGRPGEGDNVTNVEKFQRYVVGRLVGIDAGEELNASGPVDGGPGGSGGGPGGGAPGGGGSTALAFSLG